MKRLLLSTMTLFIMSSIFAFAFIVKSPKTYYEACVGPSYPSGTLMSVTYIDTNADGHHDKKITVDCDGNVHQKDVLDFGLIGSSTSTGHFTVTSGNLDFTADLTANLYKDSTKTELEGTMFYDFSEDKVYLYPHNPEKVSSVEDDNQMFDKTYSIESFKISPNPANDVIKVDLICQVDDQYSVALYDLSSNRVSNVITLNGAGTFNVTLKTVNLAPGTYFVKLNAKNNGTWFQKVVIE